MVAKEKQTEREDVPISLSVRLRAVFVVPRVGENRLFLNLPGTSACSTKVRAMRWIHGAAAMTMTERTLV